MKRSIELVEDICAEMRPTKRLSMLHNTPKQWKEQRKTILKMSKYKLKELGDIESNLRKSVLINNTYRKMRRELKEQCPYSTNPGFAAYTTADCTPIENRLPTLKIRNGYTSMAKDDCMDVMTQYSATTVNTGPAVSPLCQYIPAHHTSPATAVHLSNTNSTEHEMMMLMAAKPHVHSHTTNTVLGTDHATHQHSANTPAMNDDTVTSCTADTSGTITSLAVTDTSGTAVTSHALSHDDGECMEFEAVCSEEVENEEEQPIDYRVKGKDMTSSVSSSDHSPTPTLLHSTTSATSGGEEEAEQLISTTTRLSEDTDSKPSLQGCIYNDMGSIIQQQQQQCQDMLEKDDPEISSNDQLMTDSSSMSDAATHQDQSVTTTATSINHSDITQDFSLCQLSSKAASYRLLPNILTHELIPFSTSSIVSIVASREYQSSTCLSTSTTSSSLSNCNTDTVSSSSSSSCIADTTTHSLIDGFELGHSLNNNNTSMDLTVASELCEEGAINDSHYCCSTSSSPSSPDLTQSSLHCDALSSAVMSCDSDVNQAQHIWACFQQFNMAIACS